MVLLHGITDTWRTWELVLDALEARHDVLAPTLAGHAGGPPLPSPVHDGALADAVEAAMDEAGWETAHLVGNSLGGYVALQLCARGRARSCVALAPGGGWVQGDGDVRTTLNTIESAAGLAQAAAPFADTIFERDALRRRATELITVNYEHIPASLLAHQLRGAAACDGLAPLLEQAFREGWHIEPERIACPVRVVWGTEDRLLRWPGAAARYRELLPQADWVLLDDVGHCPQLDVPAECAELILGFSA
jgi:pimeloyl-ACP methyl ester carboxylesterase